jgi:hypothetical protein
VDHQLAIGRVQQTRQQRRMLSDPFTRSLLAPVNERMHEIPGVLVDDGFVLTGKLVSLCWISPR